MSERRLMIVAAMAAYVIGLAVAVGLIVTKHLSVWTG